VKRPYDGAADGDSNRLAMPPSDVWRRIDMRFDGAPFNAPGARELPRGVCESPIRPARGKPVRWVAGQPVVTHSLVGVHGSSLAAGVGGTASREGGLEPEDRRGPSRHEEHGDPKGSHSTPDSE